MKMEVNKLLNYIEDYFELKNNGLYYKKVPHGLNKNWLNKRAGSKHPLGYQAIKIKHRIYREHVLIYVLLNKKYPENEIDHKNRDNSNNSPNNIRDSTRNQNCRNRKGWSKFSKYKGVSKNKRGKPYEARITINKKRYSLGTFNTEEEAAIAYDKAALKNDPTFSKTNFPKENYNAD